MNYNNQAKNNTKHEPKYRRRVSNATLVNIQERRRRIAELLQENKTQVQISEILHCDASTVSNDITALKDQAVTYLYDLCKQDLCFFYHQTIADIDHVRGECWNMYHSTNKKITPKDRLQALRVIGQLDIARFELLSRGEVVMSVKSLNERINAIKSSQALVNPQQQQQQANKGGRQ
jgi:DNA-binding CsgD family transcriptional regulator